MNNRVISNSVTRPADTTAYAAGDVIGGTTTSQFSGIPRTVGGGALIMNGMAMSTFNQATKLDLELWLFSADITDLDADNAAFTPTDAQLATLVAIVAFPVASWKAGDATSGTGGNACCVIANQQIAVNNDVLYGVFIARNTYTPGSAEVITAQLSFIQQHGGK